MSELEWDGRLDGDDEYCYRPETTLIVLADTIAKKHGLDPALVCALCEVESSWIPWAVRHEAGYKWIVGFHKMTLAEAYSDISFIDADENWWAFEPQVINEFPGSAQTELLMQQTSWGLLQIMGATARERGFRGWLTELCDPQVNLEWGCKHLRWMELNADSYGIELCADVSTVPTRLCGLPQSLAAAWNAGSVRYGEDGKLINVDYVRRAAKAMEGYQ